MKKTSILIGAFIACGSLICFHGLGGPGGGQGTVVKESVTKVLASHMFTPPVALPGPGGATWYVGCRSLTPSTAEEAIIGHRGGTNFTVELAGFHRDKNIDPWAPIEKGSVAAHAAAEKSMREQLATELSKEEKPGQPSPAQKEKAK